MVMKSQREMTAHELEELARFLDEHPGFSPLFTGEDATLRGFQVGEAVLSVGDLKQLCGTPCESRLRTLLAVEAERAGGL
jgi:hypothetical protein